MRTPHRPSLALVATATVLAVAAPTVVFARGGDDKDHRGPSGTSPSWPATIALPNAFAPEGIASNGRHLFVGSIPTGAVYRADPRTGQGAVLVPPRAGRAAIGVKVAGKQLVVAGGTTGRAFIYDARTGADVADVALTSGNAFINDVAVGGRTAWFTDSRQPQLYKVDLANPTATTVPITGAMQYDGDPATNEANGIVALKGGKQLLVVQSRTGQLFRIDAQTGVSVEVPIAGGPLTNGDGLLLIGKTLFVVQNRLNQIAVIKLARDFSSGTIKQTITSPLFRVPTTLALSRGGLYAVNARFGTPPSPTTDYDVVRVPVRK